jgi:hypothetical protein
MRTIAYKTIIQNTYRLYISYLLEDIERSYTLVNLLE